MNYCQKIDFTITSFIRANVNWAEIYIWCWHGIYLFWRLNWIVPFSERFLVMNIPPGSVFYHFGRIRWHEGIVLPTHSLDVLFGITSFRYNRYFAVTRLYFFCINWFPPLTFYFLLSYHSLYNLRSGIAHIAIQNWSIFILMELHSPYFVFLLHSFIFNESPWCFSSVLN